MLSMILFCRLNIGSKDHLEISAEVKRTTAQSGYIDHVDHGKGIITLACRNTKELKQMKGDEVHFQLSLQQAPNAIISGNSPHELIVSAGEGQGYLYFINSKDLSLKQSVEFGHSPYGLSLSPQGKILAVAQRFSDEVWLMDLEHRKIFKKIKVTREPIDLKWKDEHHLVVLHHLSDRAATDAWTGASMSVIDLRIDHIFNIPLEDGSTAPRKLCLTPDRSMAMAAMVIGSHRVPATQIEQGWINKNGLSVVDLNKKKLMGTLLLDSIFRGAANPWDTVIAHERCWITLAGTHEVMSVDYQKLIQYLRTASTKEREDLTYDLRIGRDWKKRYQLKGKGPRSISANKNGIIVSTYFSDSIEFMSWQDAVFHERSPATPTPKNRLGELLFHDATICFQSWMSCSSCHSDARTDAFNWDLENDGLGTQRQAKSMLFAHQTPPTTITGIRPNAETSVRAGLAFLRAQRSESDAKALDDYLSSLKPVQSPERTRDGQLTPQALQGQKIFEERNCTDCHRGAFLTNKKMRFVGTGLGNEEQYKFDVPTLKEIWRTAPYLHDGRSKNLSEMLTTHNSTNQHGDTQDLSEGELQALIAFIRSQ